MTQPQPDKLPDPALAELARFAAAGIIVVGITLLTLGYRHVLADWLALALGLPITVVGGVLLWKANGRQAAAGQAEKSDRSVARRGLSADEPPVNQPGPESGSR